MATHQCTPFTHEQRTIKFWEKVDKSGGEDSCWIWTGARNKKGYGNVLWDGSPHLSHRIVWSLCNGDIPDGLQVLHNCPDGDNPSCVNPKHLWLGTNEENAQDKENKGRANHVRGETHGANLHPELILRGSKNGNAKLTEEDAVVIRRRYTEGNITQSQLARDYSVYHSTIGRIVRYETWTHITDAQAENKPPETPTDPNVSGEK